MTCATVVVFNDPTHGVSNLLLIPVLLAVGWLAGFALHERAERCTSPSNERHVLNKTGRARPSPPCSDGGVR